jgi:diacylglycerol kinase (ATP)
MIQSVKTHEFGGPLTMDTFPSFANPVVILNPVANRGKMDKHRAVVRDRARSEQARYIETTKQGEAKELAMSAAKEGSPVIIVGGDGSVHEAVNGILSSGSRVPLGIVGAGSGNDFAWNTLKLPKDPVHAIEKAFYGQLIEVDAGIVNGTYFANSFSVGLDADIAVSADRMKNIPFMSGARLYYTSTIKELLLGYRKCPWLAMQLLGGDGSSTNIQNKRFVLIAVTNGPTYGAGFRINPRANHADGLFDVCTIEYTPLLRALKLLPVVKKGEHLGLPEVSCYLAKSVSIESQHRVNVQMDGETSNSKSYSVENLPSALLLRV